MALPPVKKPSSYTNEIGPVSFGYQVTLIGKRRGPFSDNIVIRRQATIPPVLFNQLLLSTGRGSDLIRETKAEVIGDAGMGTINMCLCMPGQDRPFPLDTDIPLTILLTTASVPVTYSANSDTANDFDALTPMVESALLHKVLHLQLLRRTRHRVSASQADPADAQSETKTTLAPDLRIPGAMDVDTRGPREWLHDAKLGSKGRWVQQFVIRSQIRLNSATFTPTFRSEHDSVNVSIFSTLGRLLC